MKTILNTLFLSSIIFILASCGGNENSEGKVLIDKSDKSKVEKEEFTETEELYVLARNGLRMRKGTDLKSEKMEVVPYGTKLQAVTSDAHAIPPVGGMRGSMVKVFHGKEQGYMFDGYLSSLPVPQKNQGAEEYAKYLKRKSIPAKFETEFENEITLDEKLTLPTKSLQEAILIGQRIHYFMDYQFDIPKRNAKTLDFSINGKKFTANRMKRTGSEEEYEGDIAFMCDKMEGANYWFVTIGFDEGKHSYKRLILQTAYEGGSWSLTVEKKGDGYELLRNSVAD